MGAIDIKHAIDAGSIDEIRSWCEHHDVNRARIQRMPLLHYACRIGQVASVRALHAAGANPNIVDRHDMFAMDVASWYGEVRNGVYSQASQEIVAFLASVGGRHAREEDAPFWRRDVGSYFKRLIHRPPASADMRRQGVVTEALHPKDPELVSAVRAAGEAAREVAVVAAERALSETRVTLAPVSAVLESLRTGNLPAAAAYRPALEQTLERLEDEYLATAGAEPRDEDAILRAFSRARAVTALCATLESTSEQAAMDAIYEAYHALPEDRARDFLAEMIRRLSSLR